MIIGLSGVMGSGKSTAIEILRSYGKEIELVKFAQPLYDIQEMIYHRIKFAYKRPNTFIKDRKLLQFLGTDWARNTISETLWIDLWKNEVEIAEEEGFTIIVSDDVRFDNEAEAIKSMGGIVIRIDCKRAEERITTANGFKNHASEAGIDKKYIDYTIDNNGSLEDYRQALCSLFDKLFPSQS